MMTNDVMLTTIDNPYDPFTQYEEWLTFDETYGYHTNGLLARRTFTSDELSDEDQDQAIQMAIEEIIQENVSGMHVAAHRDKRQLRT